MCSAHVGCCNDERAIQQLTEPKPQMQCEVCVEMQRKCRQGATPQERARLFIFTLLQSVYASAYALFRAIHLSWLLLSLARSTRGICMHRRVSTPAGVSTGSGGEGKKTIYRQNCTHNTTAKKSCLTTKSPNLNQRAHGRPCRSNPDIKTRAR